MKTLVIQKLLDTMSSVTIATLISLGTSVAASAGDMPKEFDFVVTFTYATKSSEDIKLGEKDAGNSWRADMVAINDAGDVFMNNMAGNCADFGLNIAGAREGLGACLYEDSDGDFLYETYRLHTRPAPTTIAFVGGTGKFAGIECKGEAKIVGWARGGAAGVGKKKGSCKFAK